MEDKEGFLTLKRSSFLNDWYLIERRVHENRVWVEKTGPSSSSVMDSARISDADVEGTAEEMLAIADAIERRDSVRFKRCSVQVVGKTAVFCSPRNSRENGTCSLADADLLAKEIRGTLQNQERTSP